MGYQRRPGGGVVERAAPNWMHYEKTFKENESIEVDGFEIHKTKCSI